jgi:anti-anti-sigma factor
MEFSAGRIADAVVATPVGSVDHATALQLQERLAPCLAEAAAARCSVVLDLSGVDYISSMGLRVLMMAAKTVRASGGCAAVAGLQPVVREIFEIARFQHVLPAYASVAEALQALAPRAAEPDGTGPG